MTLVDTTVKFLSSYWDLKISVLVEQLILVVIRWFLVVTTEWLLKEKILICIVTTKLVQLNLEKLQVLTLP